MAGILDRVRAVETVVREWHLEEVPAHNLAKQVEPNFLVVNMGLIHLVIIDNDAHDLCARVGHDGLHGPIDSAPNIEDSIFELHVNQIDDHFFLDVSGLAVGLSDDRW